MFNVGSLTKQTIAVLDKYLTHYQLQCHGNKKAKLCEVRPEAHHAPAAWIQSNSIHHREQSAFD